MLVGITQLGITKVWITLVGITQVGVTQGGNACTKRVNNFNDSYKTKNTNAYKKKQLENAVASEHNDN